jgi:hypothetical protein
MATDGRFLSHHPMTEFPTLAKFQRECKAEHRFVAESGGEKMTFVVKIRVIPLDAWPHVKDSCDGVCWTTDTHNGVIILSAVERCDDDKAVTEKPEIPPAIRARMNLNLN